MEIKIGTVFERLKVVSEPFLSDSGAKRRSFVRVVCSCDGKEFDVSLSDLKAGKRKSCGCLKKEAAHMKTHQMSKTRIYGIWADMKKRCDNPNHVKFADYGGRGISYESSWGGFEAFYSDMCEGYSDTLELERKDNSKGYSKENCVWESRSNNCHNRRKRKGSALSSVGVCKHGVGYRATLHKDGKKIYSKTFKTEAEAAIAYDNISEQIYGDRPNGTESIAKED